MVAPTGQAKAWRLGIEGWAASLRDPALREVASDLDQRWKAELTQVIEEGAAAGEFRCEDPRSAAWRLTTLLGGMAVRTTSYAGPLCRAAMLRWTDEALACERGIDPADLTRSPAVESSRNGPFRDRLTATPEHPAHRPRPVRPAPPPAPRHLGSPGPSGQVWHIGA